MTNVRKKQIRTLGILLVAVIGLAVGFAAFTSSLNIKTRLSVNPNNGTFLVKFSNSSSTLDESDVVPTKSSDIFTAYNVEIDNDTGIPTISNLGGQFTQPGEKITYDFYTLNTGSYNAYLTDVIFNNVEGESTNKVCTSIDGTHQSEVDEACKGISIKVIMGIDTIINTRTMTGHTLAPNASEPVRVVIEYSSTAVLPEVEFTVDFGTISMIYNSLEQSDVVANNSDDLYPLPYPDACFTSFTAGRIDLYNPYKEGCGPDVVIPDSLPVTTLSYEYSQSKCLSYIQKMINNIPSIGEMGTPEQLCTYVQQQVQGSLAEMEEADELNYPGLLAEYGSILNFTYTTSGSSYTITKIGDNAFLDYSDGEIYEMLDLEKPSKITSVTIPNTVTEIGTSAFSNNLITSVTIPSSVISIGDSAFSYNQLSTLDLSEAISLTTVETQAFYSNNLTSVTIPNSVTTIGGYAFDANSLTEVVIGSSIQNIGSSAFGNSENSDYENQHTYGPNELTSVTINIIEPQQESQTYYDLVGNNQFTGYSGTIHWAN